MASLPLLLTVVFIVSHAACCFQPVSTTRRHLTWVHAKTTATTMASLQPQQKEELVIRSKQAAECQRVFEKMQSMFPDVPMISSQEFVRMGDHASNHKSTTTTTTDDTHVVLVDVRSAAERNVSIIEGAVPLSEMEGRITELPPNTHIITYCTVGFRGCLEARRLKQMNSSIQVSSLDGIACLSHQTTNGGTKHRKPKIVHPVSGEEVNCVHSFGEKWDNCVSEQYSVSHFSAPLLMAYSLQFGASYAWRSLKCKLWSRLPKK